MASKSMIHLNSDILCTIHIRTSGIIPGFHDLVQICILPVNSELKPNMENYPPFWMNFIPNRPDNFDSSTANISKEKFEEAEKTGLASSAVSMLFEKWYKKLELKENKHIAPLAWNFPYVQSFLIEWLGINSYWSYFDYRYRDLIPAAALMNDRADFQSERYPYPKYNLTFLCSQLKVERQSKLHDCLADAVAVTECYRKMMFHCNDFG